MPKSSKSTKVDDLFLMNCATRAVSVTTIDAPRWKMTGCVQFYYDSARNCIKGPSEDRDDGERPLLFRVQDLQAEANQFLRVFRRF
jgi:hypothetical protein